MTMAALIVFAVVGGVTWLAVTAEQPSQRLRYRRILLSVAIASTIGLVVMLALFVVLLRAGPESPAGAVPLLLSIPCAVVAVPSWIGFAVQTRLAKQQ
jgi:cytochrome bd-type quinol oxidase subunit 2